MNVVAWILGVILAGVFSFAGVTKLLDLDRMREHFGYPKRRYQLIGLLEISAVIAVIIGLISTKLEWLGVLAGVGLSALMVGALMAHASADDDTKKVIPAAVMLVVAILYMIFISVR